MQSQNLNLVPEHQQAADFITVKAPNQVYRLAHRVPLIDRLARLHKQKMPVYIAVLQVSNKVLVQVVTYPSEMRE